ncbi:MAG TPA: AI-2E family transporter [Egibacteraceae bacterium]|nr:AI-2E family transporter [Egibacteraceae bacterium]
MERTILQRANTAVWLAVGSLLLLVGLFWLLREPVGVLLPPILLAMLIVYVLNPLVMWLERRGIARWAGVGIAYLTMALTIGVLVAVLSPLLAEQVRNFANDLPQLGNRLVSGVNDLLARLGANVRVSESLSGDRISEEVERFLSDERNREAVLALLGGISGVAMGLVHLLVVFIAGPFVAFYVLVDLPRLGRWAHGALPPRHRDEADVLARKLAVVVGGYVRGQLLVATFVGMATSIGLWAIGLRFWLLVGILAGVTNLVPLIGPFVGGLVGVTIALVTEGPALALLVVLVVTVVQQLDGHVVSPLVVGRNVQLHPLAVLLALLVAGTLYGIFGMLVAIPLVAAVNVVIVHFWRTRVPWLRAERQHHLPAAAESIPSDSGRN